MFGLNIKVTALLLNILVVHGKVFRQEKFLQDKNHIEMYQSLYSDDPSDYSGVVNSDFDVWRPKITPLYPGLNYGKINPGWFPKPNPAGPMGPVGPIDTIGPIAPIGPINPVKPVAPRAPGHWRRPGRGSRSGMCQHIKGLPKPESGCCGVQLMKYPGQQHYPNKANKPIPSQWPAAEFERFRRSVDRDTAPTKMIIGGRATDLHHLPWMARLAINARIPNLHRPKGCGGTIISSRYILTAAHCVHEEYEDISQLEVYLAEYDTDTYPEDCIKKGGRRNCIKNYVMKVEEVIKHENYDDKFLKNDVALLRLSSEIPYTKFTRPICLPTSDIADLHDETFVIAGWGLNGKTESNVKQAAFVDYVPDAKCKDQYSYKDDSMFCTIGEHGEDICHGDSGGPLMVFLDNKYYLSGVANGKRNGTECGSDVPSLFNNVYYHMDWIEKHVK